MAEIDRRLDAYELDRIRGSETTQVIANIKKRWTISKGLRCVDSAHEAQEVTLEKNSGKVRDEG